MNVAELLDSATTSKAGAKRAHLEYPGDSTAAELWLQLTDQLQELEREAKLLRETVLAEVSAWHADVCQRQRQYHPTVTIGKLMLSFQNRYKALAASKEAELRDAVGSRFDEYFVKQVSLRVKKAIAGDHAMLSQVITQLVQMVGRENFLSWFEVEQSLAPTTAFTHNVSFTAAQREKLAAAGVEQVVSMRKAA